jgi:hypothetical protein
MWSTVDLADGLTRDVTDLPPPVPPAPHSHKWQAEINPRLSSSPPKPYISSRIT